jgi:hypothetical protein
MKDRKGDRMKASIVGMALFASVLGGCAPVEPPPVGPNHPASPDAAQAPEASFPDALVVDEANLPAIPLEMQPGGVMDHGGGMMQPRVAGMDTTRPASSTSNEAEIYTCPMHPEVLSKQPGKCPKCGMELVPREAHAHE